MLCHRATLAMAHSPVGSAPACPQKGTQLTLLAPRAQAQQRPVKVVERPRAASVQPSRRAPRQRSETIAPAGMPGMAGGTAPRRSGAPASSLRRGGPRRRGVWNAYFTTPFAKVSATF